MRWGLGVSSSGQKLGMRGLLVVAGVDAGLVLIRVGSSAARTVRLDALALLAQLPLAIEFTGLPSLVSFARFSAAVTRRRVVVVDVG